MTQVDTDSQIFQSLAQAGDTSKQGLLAQQMALELGDEAPANASSSFPNALKLVRKALGLGQDDFSAVSGRTYLSALERGMKSPTLKKIEALAEVLKVHPVTLIALSYTAEGPNAIQALVERVNTEMHSLTGCSPIL